MEIYKPDVTRLIELINEKRSEIMKYIIAAHVKFNEGGPETFGPAHNINDFLQEKNKKVIFIKHCIEGIHPSKLENAGKISNIDCRFYNRNQFLRYWERVRINIARARNLKTKPIYIGVDPINGLAGVLLKRNKLVKEFIYFSADYADRRFANFFLNSIYHLIDRLCLKRADQIWAVSSRIVKKRTSQGVEPARNHLLPNSPDFGSIKRRLFDGNHNLIVVSHLSKSLNLAPVFRVIKALAGKFPDIKLLIVGSGPEQNNFLKQAKKMGIGKNVDFMGQKAHAEVMDLLSRSFIGIALYTKDNDWNRYGDSMKAREYVGCGLPVIINDIPSTADDIAEYSAGLVLSAVSSQRIVEFVSKCINDKKFYLNLRKNALKLGKAFDKKAILEKLLRLETQ